MQLPQKRKGIEKLEVEKNAMNVSIAELTKNNGKVTEYRVVFGDNEKTQSDINNALLICIKLNVFTYERQSYYSFKNRYYFLKDIEEFLIRQKILPQKDKVMPFGSYVKDVNFNYDDLKFLSKECGYGIEDIGDFDKCIEEYYEMDSGD